MTATPAQEVPRPILFPPDTPVVVRLLHVMGEVGYIPKSQRNREQGFAFRGIDQVLHALHSPLADAGVLMVPEVIERVAETRPKKSGDGIMYAVALHVRFTFHGPAGDTITGSAWGEATDAGDKATGKAMSQALKSFALQTFVIPTEDMGDADATTPEPTYTEGQIRRAEAAAKAAREATALPTLQNIGAHAYEGGILDAPVRGDGDQAVPLRAVLDARAAVLRQDNPPADPAVPSDPEQEGTQP